jgi:hypothetical protein
MGLIDDKEKEAAQGGTSGGGATSSASTAGETADTAAGAAGAGDGQTLEEKRGSSVAPDAKAQSLGGSSASEIAEQKAKQERTETGFEERVGDQVVKEAAGSTGETSQPVGETSSSAAGAEGAAGSGAGGASETA